MANDPRTLDGLPLRGKRVLVRVDYNVPLEKDGTVADDRRIAASLPTVRRILEAPAAAILCSHLGRPKAKPEAKYSLAPVARRLAELLGRPVSFVPDCVGPAAEAAAAAAKPGDCLLLENLRFHPGEEKNDPAFAASLARLADLYVDDAFGAAHRAHASVSGVPALLPSGAGYLLAREVEVLQGLLREPKRPFVVITGGAKVSDKVPVLRNLLPLADALLVGGGMAYTFLRARGVAVGKSLVEETAVQAAREILREADVEDVEVVLPVDHVCAERLEAGIASRVAAGSVPADLAGLDIGPATVEEFAGILGKAGTVLWNGPLGAFETPPFD
ncbi:MAG: phosphoglycerate kinase, partial [Planctomycetaceae bacterium]|nr:phosphoglycerate kinase [Planctomycetaceae bacterium]